MEHAKMLGFGPQMPQAALYIDKFKRMLHTFGVI